MKCPYCDGTGELTAHGPGPLILAVRRKLGLTQAEVATKAGFTRAQLANLETGRTDIPTRRLLAIAAALGVSAGELLP